MSILIQRTIKSFIIEEFEEVRGQRVATLIRRTSESLITEAFRGGERVASLIERTNKSLIIEESRGSAGSDFDQAHEGELDYSMV